MPSQKAETATSGLAAVAACRYRCVSLVCAGMAPKTWSLVQSVTHSRWYAEIYMGSRPRHNNWDDDPSWARNLRVGRDGKPSGACSAKVGDKEGSIAQNARFGATGPARVRDDYTSRWIASGLAQGESGVGLQRCRSKFAPTRSVSAVSFKSLSRTRRGQSFESLSLDQCRTSTRPGCCSISSKTVFPESG